jgi:short-subunit dehydrogenase
MEGHKMPRPLQEQVAVITGASSGIGREAALRFGRSGASVVLAARNELALQQVAAEIQAAGGQARVVITDVSDAEAMNRLASEAVNAFGRVDTWVNNAGTAIYATVEQSTVEEMRRVIEVDLLGTIYGVKAILPYMRQQGYGTIINIGSVESVRALPFHAAYAAAKHGVKGFTEALRLELQRKAPNIQVTLILPAGINTPFFNHARSKLGVKPMPMPPAYKPELAADAILQAAQNPQRDIYVGGASWMFSFLERVSPALMDHILMLGDMSFRLQKTNEPDDGQDNLFSPVVEAGRVEGDFANLTKPSMYTWLMEFSPAKLLLVPAAVAAVLVLFGMRRR